MELKLSDEQYEKIGEAISKRIQGLHTEAELGRAAVDAVLAKMLPVVLAPMSDEEDAEYLHSDADDSFEWVRKHRLARFIAPKDAAMERIIGPQFRTADGRLAQLSEEAAALIVDSVRAADREAARMTQQEALEEARKRWGGYAWAALNKDRKYCVGAGTPPPLAPFGVGESWESAFANTDHREQETPR